MIHWAWLIPAWMAGGISGMFVLGLVSQKNKLPKEKQNMNDNRCICCGAAIPEGRMVCPSCETKERE